MAYRWIPNEPVLKYKGITIYHVYKDDDNSQGYRKYIFGLDKHASDLSNEEHISFDIRDLQAYDSKLNNNQILRHAIDSGEITQDKINKPDTIKKLSPHDDDKRYIKRLYEAYQLDWMMRHGFSLEDVIEDMDKIPEYHDGHIYDYCPDDGSGKDTSKNGMRANIDGIFHDWEWSGGFSGEALYDCEDKFCEDRLLNVSYFMYLLKAMGSSIDKAEYLNWYSQYIARKASKGDAL